MIIFLIVFYFHSTKLSVLSETAKFSKLKKVNFLEPDIPQTEIHHSWRIAYLAETYNEQSPPIRSI